MASLTRIPPSLGYVFPAVLCLFLLVDPLLLTPIHYSLLASVAGVVFLVMNVQDGVSLREYPTLLLMLAAVGLSVAGSSFTGNPLEYVLVLATVVFAVPTLTLLDRDRFCRFLRMALLVLLAVVLIPIFDQYLNQLVVFGTYGYYSVPSGALINPNVLARFLGLTACFLLLSRGQGWVGWFSVSAGFVAGLGVFWTGSRGAILGLVLAGGAYVLRRVKWSWFIVAGIGLLAVVTVFLLVGQLDHVTNMQRVKLAGESVRMVLDHPVLGVGAWNFGLEYPAYSTDDHWQRHPHSLPLWILSAFGGLGLITAGIIVERLRRAGPDWRFLPLIVFLVTHELVDSMLWIPGMLLLTTLLLTPMFLSGSNRSTYDETSEKHGRDGSVAVFAERSLVVVFVLLGLFTAWSGFQFNEGVRQAHQGRWDAASTSWSRVPQAFGTAHQALAEYREGSLERAISLLKQAERQNPLDPYYPYILSELDVDVAGRQARKRYESLDPHDTLSLRDPPEGWGRAKYPPEFGEIGEATLRPAKLKRHPRRAGWYLPLVDRSLRTDDCQLALSRVRVLLNYPAVTRFARIQLESRRLSCYRMMGKTDRVESQRRRLERLRNREPSLRSTYHHFFYRRTGYDHAFFQ